MRNRPAISGAQDRFEPGIAPRPSAGEPPRRKDHPSTSHFLRSLLDRQWVGIDISDKAVDLVQLRVRQIDLDLFHNFEPIRRSDIPKRTDLGKLPSYRTHKHQLFGKQEGRCGGCREAFPFRNFTIDHVVPQSKGGTDHFDNLQLLCGACNSTKGAGTQAELIAKLKEQGIR